MNLVERKKQQLDKRLKTVSTEEFKQMVNNRTIRSASMEDILGTHHQKPLYQHPNTGYLWVQQ